MTGYEFDRPELLGVRTLARLDSTGIRISVIGPGIKHSELVTAKSTINDPGKLSQAEWMIRGFFPNAKERGSKEAEEYTLSVLSTRHERGGSS